MSESTNISMTPPMTPPPLELKGGMEFDSDSLDYMDFFNVEMDASPIKEVEVEEQGINIGLLLFSCRGRMQWSENFPDTSCLGKKSLMQLLQMKNPSPSCWNSNESIFNFPCTAELVQRNLEHYFMCVSQGIDQLVMGAQSSVCLSQSCHDAEYPKTREDIAKFFNCLLSHVFMVTRESTGKEEFLRTVVKEITILLKFLGPLHDLPEHVTSASSPLGNKCPSAAHHLLHLHLDIRWWSLCLLQLIEGSRGNISTHAKGYSTLILEPHVTPSGGSVTVDEQPITEQVASLIIWDLITIMCRECLKRCVSDLHTIPGFSCTCSLELSIMVLHVLDHRHLDMAKQGFWDQVKNKLLILLKMVNESSGSHECLVSTPASFDEQQVDIIEYPAPFVKNIRLPHIWWIFTNFSKVYSYDGYGNLLPPKSIEVKSEPKLLRTLVKLSFGELRISQQLTEVEMRFFIRSCLILHHLWGGERSSEWATLLWDFFAKQLDSSFLLPGAGLEGLACMSKTAGGWLEQVKSRIPDPELLGKSESSWQIFLRIVVGVVQSGSLEWRQMRGRIYSKFHGRKMLELSPIGLHNSVTLFLCLAHTTDTIDVANKLGELLTMIVASNVNKLKVIWRGFLATILLLVEAGCTVSPLTQKFSALFSSACQEYISSRDATHKRDFGQLIILYAEGVQEIFEYSNDLSLAQHSLISSGFNSILPSCGVSELKAILLALNSALNKVLRNSERLHCLTVHAGLDLVEVIWKEFGAFIKSQATVQTPSTVLGTVAALLTFSMAQYSQNTVDGLKEAACGMFSHFVGNETVNVKCSLQYIQSLLSEANCVTRFKQVCPTYEVQLIACWLSALVTEGVTEELAAVTSLVTGLSEVSSILYHPSGNPFAIAKAFVRSISKKFSEMANFSERMVYRETAMQYFSSMDKAYETLLKKLPPPSYLPSAIELFASVIYFSHSIIYVKSRPTCPLPSLISTVILPTNIYSSEKALNPVLSGALMENMPRIICGLGSLTLTQDPYLVRCMKNIFTHYIHRFPVKTNKNYSTVLHPFITCLHDSDMKEANSRELRSIFLTAIRDNCLDKSGNSNGHQIVISLLLELMVRSARDWVSNIVSFLMLPILELLLTMEDQTTKRLATEFLQKLLLEAQKRNTPPRTELVKIIRMFVLQHISWSSHRLFRILGVIGKIHRPLAVDCLPCIAHAVRTTEEKRGTGLDHTLRQGYHSLLKSLGENEEDIENYR